MNLPLTIQVIGFFLSIATSAVYGQQATRDEQINSLIGSLGGVASTAPPPPEEWRIVGDQWVRGRQMAVELRDLVLLDPNASVIWPGALVQGGSLAGSVLTPISLSRGPVEIYLNGIRGRVENGQPRALSVRIDQPNAANINNALSNLVALADPETSVAHQVKTERFFRSLNEAFTHVGVSIGSIVGSFRAALDSDTYASKNNLMIDFTQKYYTASIVPLSKPSDYFAQDVAFSSVAGVCNDGNPPVYLTDIAYGRRLLFLFSSTYSKERLKAAVDASWDALLASGSVDARRETVEVLQQTEMRALIIGGGSVTATNTMTGGDIQTAIGRYIAEGANPVRGVNGAPISFRASYLKDNSVAVVKALGEVFEQQPAKQRKYYLRWYNHLEPQKRYKVVRNMAQGQYGSSRFPATNDRYKPFVAEIVDLPGAFISEKEVAGDERFKIENMAENGWTRPPYSCPSLLLDGLRVMNDERWYLVEYEEPAPRPSP